MRVALLATLCFAAFPALAEVGVARTAECALVVQGQEIISGPCTFTPIDADGSFTVAGLDGQYFAYVLVEGAGAAQGYWNEEPRASHAHTPLGPLTRSEACWVNATASVCAW